VFFERVTEDHHSHGKKTEGGKSVHEEITGKALTRLWQQVQRKERDQHTVFLARQWLKYDTARYAAGRVVNLLDCHTPAWRIPSGSLTVNPTSIEFDATPSKRDGLGGTGALTITVSNVSTRPPPPPQSGTVTAGDGSFYSGS
jgi:hypothetical protein